MRYIFDASSLVMLFMEQGSKAAGILAEESTIDLAAYEIGNILWKECSLKHSIKPNEAEERARDAAKILETMRLERLGAEDLPEILGIALRQGITFYDAAYIYASIDDELTLVTEDKKLELAARKTGIKVISAKDIGLRGDALTNS